MKNFYDLSATDLEAIIENRKHTVINIDVPTANRVGELIGITQRIKFYAYPQNQVDKVLSNRKIDTTDSNSMWESFMILLDNSETDVHYRLDNLTDCTYDIKFKN